MNHVTPTPRSSPLATLMKRAQEMVASGRLQAARALFGALKNQAASGEDLASLEAMLLLREGRPIEAEAMLDDSLQQFPHHVVLYLHRADARMQRNEFVGAAADAADAVHLDRHNSQAKASLGVALIELGAFADAAACLAEAVQEDPRNPFYRRGLAAAQDRGGQPAAAAETLAKGLALTPGSLALHIDAIMGTMRKRDFAGAAALAERARRIGIADACVFGLLGHALSSLSRHEEALEAYTEALKLAPEDPYVRHLVAAGGIVAHSTRAPSEYLETVFDGYADRFESHLINLGYRVPGLVRAALLDTIPALLKSEAGEEENPFGPVLDLGCGTGLIGVVLSDLAIGPLLGVDISGKMLAEAHLKNLYDELIQCDLEQVLSQSDRSWQLVVAADVFCYFGQLDKVLPLAASRLMPGGLLIFTVEELHDAGAWRLGRQGRFSHSRDYIRDVVGETGLRQIMLRPEALRFEAGDPVGGMLVVLQRAG